MRVPVTELVDHPGATRAVERAVAPDDVGDAPWGPAGDALRGDLDLTLALDAVVEGVYVHGDVAWQLELDCSRCLRPVVLDRHARVGELFADPRKRDVADDVDEGYELVDDRTAIDLEQMLHDVVLLDLPTSVRCGRPDCVPPDVPGVSVRTLEEHAAVLAATPDPRWEVLADLDLQTDPN